MKTELSHDIIAEKIWDRLPEQDKRLREIERSIQQRTRDFLSGTGDYLGVKELTAWEDALSKFAPESAEYRFVQDSKAFWQAEQEAKERRQREELEKVRQQAKKERRLRNISVSFSLLAVVAALAAGFLGFKAEQQKKAEVLATSKAQERLLQALKEKDQRLRSEKEQLLLSLPIYETAEDSILVQETRQAIAEKDALIKRNSNEMRKGQ